MKASYRVEQSFRNNGEYVCYFLIDNRIDKGARGTDGTGCKIYGTKQKAEAAGKRYLKKMESNEFEIDLCDIICG